MAASINCPCGIQVYGSAIGTFKVFECPKCGTIHKKEDGMWVMSHPKFGDPEVNTEFRRFVDSVIDDIAKQHGFIVAKTGKLTFEQLEAELLNITDPEEIDRLLDKYNEANQ